MASIPHHRFSHLNIFEIGICLRIDVYVDIGIHTKFIPGNQWYPEAKIYGNDLFFIIFYLGSIFYSLTLCPTERRWCIREAMGCGFQQVRVCIRVPVVHCFGPQYFSSQKSNNAIVTMPLWRLINSTCKVSSRKHKCSKW